MKEPNPKRPEHTWFQALLMTALLFAGVATARSAQAAGIESLERIEKAAVAAQRAALGDVPGNLRLEAISLDRRLRLATCPLPPRGEAQSARGQVVSVRVSCQPASGERRWSLYVQVRIRHFLPVLVTANTVAAGETFDTADIRQEEREVSALRGRYLSDRAALHEQVAARPLRAGQVLTQHDLKALQLVERNQQVRLRRVIGGARIEAVGEALSPGSRGERVRVRNTGSGRVLEGRVVAAGVVQVGG